MARIPPPFTHPTWHWRIYRNVYHYTSLLNSTFAPTLAFSCLLIGFIPSDIFNQPRLLWADWQIGSVITTTKHARWGQFYLKKNDTHEHDDTFTQTYVCTEAWLHTYTQVPYGMTAMFDEQFELVMVTVVCPPVICLICLIHSWFKIPR